MRFPIIDKNKKILYGLINASILCFIGLWVIIFILKFINNEIISKATTYLLLLSILPLISGLISLVALTVSGNRFVEFNEHEKICLTLNLSEEDFKNQKFDSLGYSGNFVALVEHGLEYEISSTQAKELLFMNDHLNWQIRLLEGKNKILTESPKAIFNSAMNLLWAAS